MEGLRGWLDRGFRWRDGARLVRFGLGAAADTPRLLDAERLAPFILLTTPRAAAALPALAAAAATVVHVPAGPVPEAAAAVEERLGGLVNGHPSLVALGGGRVIDAAKAVAAAQGLAVAAVPTTLSGAEMTASHRPLPDGRGATPATPRLVVTDPELLTLPLPGLAATAMNAFGHAFEALYLPNRSPVTSWAALDAAGLLIAALEGAQRRGQATEGERGALALGGLLAGYAIGATGLGFHHALCQTVVRHTGAPHAQVYGVLGPHVLRFMLPRAADELAPLVALLAARDGEDAVASLAALAAVSGATRLRGLGVGEAQLPSIVDAACRRPEVRDAVGGAPSREDVLAVLTAAL